MKWILDLKRAAAVAWVALLAASCAVSSKPEKNPAGPDKPARVSEDPAPDLRARVGHLIKKLGSKAYRDRKSAHDELLKLGPALLPLLEKMGEPSDPEIRTRLASIKKRLIKPETVATLAFHLTTDDPDAKVMKIKREGDPEPLRFLVEPELDETAVSSATAAPDAGGVDRYRVAIVFSEEGSAIMESITSRNHGKVLGIFVNGELTIAPVIQATISKQAVIAGNMTEAEARKLADDINARGKSK